MAYRLSYSDYVGNPAANPAPPAKPAQSGTYRLSYSDYVTAAGPGMHNV